MRRINPKYLFAVGAVWAVWLIVSVAVYLTLFVPQNREYADVHKQWKAQADELELARKASLTATRSEQLQVLEKTLEELAWFTIGPRQQDRLVFEVSRLASEMNLSDYTGSNRGVLEKSASRNQKSPIERFFLDMTFSGSFDRFAQFLNALERNCPTLFIEMMSIERGQDSQQHEASILLSLLIQKEELVVPQLIRLHSEPTARRTEETKRVEL